MASELIEAGHLKVYHLKEWEPPEIPEINSFPDLCDRVRRLERKALEKYKGTTSRRLDYIEAVLNERGFFDGESGKGTNGGNSESDGG